MKLAVLFGSSSNEHEVSVVSAAAVIKNLDKSKYDITPIYMDKENNFYKWLEPIDNIKPLKIGILPTNLEEIKDIFQFLKDFSLVFVMIHGKNGEDGILSAILEFLNIKYVANKPAASIVTMDKIYTKDILEANNIKTSKYMYFTKYNEEYLVRDETLSYEKLEKRIEDTLKYPIFIKPANSGSSIGITKANNSLELKKGINLAIETDKRVLLEEEVIGREVEVGVLERDKEIIASVVGEVMAADQFYSFDAKYINSESKTIIPANLEEEISQKIRETAIKIFKVLNVHGYSRIDFFVTKNKEILLNEINTIPGFTEISMYPKLIEASGISYSELLDILIREALNR